MKKTTYPNQQGLYDPAHEHDACGVGFVAHVKGRKSHKLVNKGLEMLANLDHRGGCGAEPDTGDGAGILIQIPHAFFAQELRLIKIALPSEGSYGVGMIFLPQEIDKRKQCCEVFEQIIVEEALSLIAWRRVPVNPSQIGPSAKSCMPAIEQVFIGNPNNLTSEEFERKLYVVRKRVEQAIRYASNEWGSRFYIASLSSSTIVYKGMLTPIQLPQFYLELQDLAVETGLVLVHSRFSTNTFPSWERAHPNRYIAHNGEINTLRGNMNWMNARQAMFASAKLGADLQKVGPVLDPDGSDSSMFDNCLDFLQVSGYSLPHALMMMIPEPWVKHESMTPERRAFYEYHSCLMEPWDGPASLAFTDGRLIGAVLDRNGLRPSRYYVTKDDFVVMASEVGVLDIPSADIISKGRLQPGRLFLVDTKQGRIIEDAELKATLASAKPYQKWLQDNLLAIDELPNTVQPIGQPLRDITKRQQIFGYSYEELSLLLAPMAKDGVEPIGSMGTDIPLAVLSNKPQLLYNYFKQLFAQVTNPPIDAIREDIVISTDLTLGSEGNLLEPDAQNCRLIKLTNPVLTNEQLGKLQFIQAPDFRTSVLPILFAKEAGGEGLERALADLFVAADRVIAEGTNILILSDRQVDEVNLPIPALLAVSALHHHLIRKGTRTKVGIVLESGEPREVHHLALLLGYGVSAINPYLAFETVKQFVDEGKLEGLSHEEGIRNYRKALLKGVVKIMSKMGISTIQSYKGAQIFEAIGISATVTEPYFTGTPSRIGGIDLEIIAQEVVMRHQRAYESRDASLDSGGDYQWRKTGEEHLYSPEAIHTLQFAVRTNNYELYKDYAQRINDQEATIQTLRGLLAFRTNREPIALDQVESVASIVKRFKTGAMSYGSISKEAHECLAIAMNRLGGKSNTGEGGEDPKRFALDPNGDSRCSRIKQVASGRFGVTSEYLVSADEIQIKMAQGAKPGEGGQLPGRKVYPWIAKVRHSTPGVGLISPPPHHDIYSIEDLSQLIHDLKNANRNARISVKLVSAIGVGTIAAGVAKGRADVILISGYDGGTGASPRSSIRHAGLPWELGLAETQQTLMLNSLRSRVVLEADGKLMTGRDVAIAALLGAEEFGFATAPLVALGCVMMRVCHLDSCPVGIATQNPDLRAKFGGNPDHVVNLMNFIAQDLREIMAQLGFRTVNEMVGQVQALVARTDINHWKAQTLNLDTLLYQPVTDSRTQYCSESQDHQLDLSLDAKMLIDRAYPALEYAQPVSLTAPINNTQRVVGTILGSLVTKKYGANGLPEDCILLKFLGSAGQSFAAFVPKGLTLTLEGDANDYIGKGLSGGKVIVYPADETGFVAHENILVGNVAFYGATSGEAYISGVAGERFCVRNSGMTAVVEGIGDHGCEYMTGGRVVVLGETGRNFAAGMSGGIAYVWDPTGSLSVHCNLDMVLLETLETDSCEEVRQLLKNHYRYTGSVRAADLLSNWQLTSEQFIKVIPKDYKRVLQAFEQVKLTGLSGEEAVMAAFAENCGNLARVGGN